jgi:ATP-binding cassette subfamily B protein
LRQGVSMVWNSARGELLVQLALQIVAGLAALAMVVLGADALRELSAVASGRDRLTDTVPTLVGLAVVVAGSGFVAAVGFERQLLMSELVSRRQRERLLRITGAVGLEAYERAPFHDCLARAQRSGMNGPIQLVTGLGQVGSNLAGMVGALAALATIEPLLVVLALGSVLPAVLISARGAENVYRFAYRLTARDREREYLASTIAERQTAAEIRAYDLAESPSPLAQVRRCTRRRAAPRRRTPTPPIGRGGPGGGRCDRGRARRVVRAHRRRLDRRRRCDGCRRGAAAAWPAAARDCRRGRSAV